MATMATREDFHAFEAKVLERMTSHLLAMMGVNTTLVGLAVGVTALLR
jgi:hypothetical protein